MQTHYFPAAVDQNVGMWPLGPAAVELEQVTLGWLADLLGYPRGSGYFGTGATMANTIGLALARQAFGEKHGIDVREHGVLPQAKPDRRVLAAGKSRRVRCRMRRRQMRRPALFLSVRGREEMVQRRRMRSLARRVRGRAGDRMCMRGILELDPGEVRRCLRLRGVLGQMRSRLSLGAMQRPEAECVQRVRLPI